MGEHIEVMVIDIRTDKVRLGVKAPQWMRVDRKEVRELISDTDPRGYSFVSPTLAYTRRLVDWLKSAAEASVDEHNASVYRHMVIEAEAAIAAEEAI